MSPAEDLWMSDDMEDDVESAPRAVRRARLQAARRRQLARQGRRARVVRRVEPYVEPMVAQTVGGEPGMDPPEDPWVNDDMLEAEEDIESALPIVVASAGGFDDSESEAVDDLFAQVVSPLSATEAESLGNALRTVGRWANDRQLGQVAGKVLPTAGAAIGTVYGGPVGTMIGSKIGERAGQALGGGSPQRVRLHNKGRRQRRSQRHPSPPQRNLVLPHRNPWETGRRPPQSCSISFKIPRSSRVWSH